jgi:hypothetical protein
MVKATAKQIPPKQKEVVSTRNNNKFDLYIYLPYIALLKIKGYGKI